jgi:hypothetical protein
MPTIRNIHLTIPDLNDQRIRRDSNRLSSISEYRVNIQTNDTWTITGEYQDNRLRTITLNRKQNLATE